MDDKMAMDGNGEGRQTMRNIKVAATQTVCTQNREANRERAERIIREAASGGANIILLQELYQDLYFCQNYDFENFALAMDKDDEYFSHMGSIAKELNVVLPISFFEKDNNCFFNSVAVIDADGQNLGLYRKTHIPDDMGYFEKFYFSPGDMGIKVWDTKFARIGVGICWDQWYPEVARIMALKGAELILYPTAIGFHTNGFTENCSDHWQQVMRGHAAANMVPVIASNRIGVEKGSWSEIQFFGRSFICNERGKIVQEADGETESILMHEFDLEGIVRSRNNFVLFRDRRPEVYGDILTLTGK